MGKQKSPDLAISDLSRFLVRAGASQERCRKRDRSAIGNMGKQKSPDLAISDLSRFLVRAVPPKKEKRKGPARKKGDRLPGMKQWADDPDRPWTKLEFDQFGLHTTLEVKTIQALYYKAGKDRLLTIVLTRDVEGKRPDQMFYCTKLDWTAREILSAYACRWAIECTFENCKQFLGLEDPANRLPKAVVRTAPMALFIYTLVVIWFHQTGHQLLRFPFRPWYTKKEEPSFADMLTTLRRVSYQEKTPQPLPEQSGLKTWIAQVTELLSRTG